MWGGKRHLPKANCSRRHVLFPRAKLCQMEIEIGHALSSAIDVLVWLITGDIVACQDLD
jgi:hypothetical protein